MVLSNVGLKVRDALGLFTTSIAGSGRRLFRDPRVWEVVRWCVPALILGLIARVLLTVAMPYGYVQFDTSDFLLTAKRLFEPEHDLVIHGKKTFLGPIVFTLPFLQPFVSPLVIIPLIHHLLGLVMTIAVGGIIRLWFSRWRWFIIPATVFTTLNPNTLWYEHALLAEFHYLFCVIAAVLAGTIFSIKKSRNSLIFLLVALFFTAGSRPEGKLFFSLALVLVALTHLGDWVLMGKRLALVSLVTIGTFLITSTGQAGLLLYATLLPLAPEAPKIDPALGEALRPLREKAIAEGPTVRLGLVKTAKELNNLIRDYYKDKALSNPQIAALAQKMAVEAALRKPHLLLPIAVNKFLMTLEQGTSVSYTDVDLYHKQTRAMMRKNMPFLSERLVGIVLNSPEEARAFFKKHYRGPRWFEKLHAGWKYITLAPALPSTVIADRTIPGAPYFFLLALVGMALSLVLAGSLTRFHISWLLTFGGVWFVVILTGVVNPRYRFIFEPFCVFYCLLVLDKAVMLISLLKGRFGNPSAPQVAEQTASTSLPS